MARTTYTPGAPVLLFDRLVDDDPKRPSEPQPYRFYDLDGLTDSIAREAQRILNCRRPISRDRQDLQALGLDGTILTFGLSDHVLDSPGSIDDQKSVSRDIAAALKAYEPRLQNVHVETAPKDRSKSGLQIFISGTIVAGKVREQFSFPVTVGGQDGIS